MSTIHEAFQIIEQGVSNEKKVQNCSNAYEAGLLLKASIDNYMKGCELFMTSLSIFAKDKKSCTLIQDNIIFYMEHVEHLNACLVLLLGDMNHVITIGNSSSNEESTHDQTKREKIVNEIVSTERTYYTSLQELIQNYVFPLTKGQHPFIDHKDAKLIWANIEEIAGLSETFLNQLSSRVGAWTEESIVGDIFKMYAMFFKNYVLYTNSYTEGLELLEEIQSNNSVINQLITNSETKSGATVASLMIQPVQRIPRYELFLKDLLKATSMEHKDYQLLSEAYNSIKVVATHVNESIRSHEGSGKVFEIQSSLWVATGDIPVLLTPGRQYIMDGKLRMNKRIRKSKKFRVFLFNDIILYTTESPILPGKYHYQGLMEYEYAHLCLEGQKRKGIPFEITGPSGKLIFTAKTLELANEWVNTIQKNVSTKRAKRNSFARLPK